MGLERLSSSVEVSGLVRRAEASGDFATVLHKGDSERGAILLVVESRGEHVGCLERSLAMDGTYRWTRVGPGEAGDELAKFLTSRTRFDPDLWLIELDVAQPERFIAETTSAG